MKKGLLLIVCANVLFSLHAQYYFYNDKYYDQSVILEVGASLGGMNCLTDLGTSAPPLKTLNFAGSFYAGILYKDVLGLRLEATFGTVGTADSLDVNKHGSRLRNLNFKSDIKEIALLAEFYPLMIKYYPVNPPRLSPYITMGIGIFSFDPQTYYQGRWIDLPPLHTEGEGFPEYPDRKPYKLTQFNFPIGGGIKYELSPIITLRGELIYRYLFTDYLDDVSTTYIDPSLFDKYLSPQNAYYAKILYSRRNEINPQFVPVPGTGRGNPKHNDSYYTFNIKIGINLGRIKR